MNEGNTQLRLGVYESDVRSVGSMYMKVMT